MILFPLCLRQLCLITSFINISWCYFQNITSHCFLFIQKQAAIIISEEKVIIRDMGLDFWFVGKPIEGGPTWWDPGAKKEPALWRYGNSTKLLFVFNFLINLRLAREKWFLKINSWCSLSNMKYTENFLLKKENLRSWYKMLGLFPSCLDDRWV